MTSHLWICVSVDLNDYTDSCTNIHDRPARYAHRITRGYHKFVHFTFHKREAIIAPRKLNACVYWSKSKYIMDEDLLVFRHAWRVGECKIYLLRQWQLAKGLNTICVFLLHSWSTCRISVRSQTIKLQKRIYLLLPDCPSTCLPVSSPRINEWTFMRFGPRTFLLKFTDRLRRWILSKTGHKWLKLYGKIYGYSYTHLELVREIFLGAKNIWIKNCTEKVDTI